MGYLRFGEVDGIDAILSSKVIYIEREAAGNWIDLVYNVNVEATSSDFGIIRLKPQGVNKFNAATVVTLNDAVIRAATQAFVNVRLNGDQVVAEIVINPS